MIIMNQSELQKLYAQKRIARSLLKSYDLSVLDEEIQINATPKQIVWHLMSGHNSVLTCMNSACNQPVKWDNVVNPHYQTERGNYRSYCSSKCSNNSSEVKLKKEQTSLQNFGVKYHSQTEHGQQIRLQTNLSKYGVENPSQCDIIKQRKTETLIKNYGVENPSLSAAIQHKKIQTNYDRYGNSHFNNKHIETKYQLILSDKSNLKHELTTKSIRELAQEIGVNKSTIIRKIHEHNLTEFLKTSYLEQEMATFLNDCNVTFDQNIRTIIPPYELDFYMPSHNLAIEMNGDYWHSDLKRDKKYHQDKWNSARNQGIRLIQIWETDWNNNKDKFKRMIQSSLNLKNRGVPARKATIDKISGKAAKLFLNKYHLQGYVAGTHFAAFDAMHRIIGVMSFGMSRNQHFELKRWVTDEYTHPGLFSKTFKFAQNELKFDKVVSFSMNDWFTGDLYEKTGFTKIEEQRPTYRYLYDNKWRHCSYFTRKGIKNKLPEYYSDDLTEFQMTNNAGILRTWDSGKIKWVWHA